MRKIQVLGLALIAVFAVSAVAAGSAFAATEWLLNGNPVTTPTAIESEGTLTLTDETNGVEVECSGIDKGTIGAGAADEVTEILSLTGGLSKIPCTLLKPGSVNCETPAEAEALELPWVTELVLNAGNEWEDLIAPHSGGGNPGWKTECLIAKIFNIAQECSAADTLTLVLNNAAEKDVEIMFEKAPSTCKNNDKASVTGTVLNFLAGNTVEVS